MMYDYVWDNGKPLNQPPEAQDTDSEVSPVSVFLKAQVGRKGKQGGQHVVSWWSSGVGRHQPFLSCSSPDILLSFPTALAPARRSRPSVGLEQKVDSGRDSLFLLETFLGYLGSIINIILVSFSLEEET